MPVESGRKEGEMSRGGQSLTARRAPSATTTGFTLIELLVVIALIALLMAVLLPSLNLVRKRARAVVCRAHLRQWGTTLALYLEDQQGRLARSDIPILPGLPLLRGEYIDHKTDPNTHRRYHAVETRGISCCPMATKVRERPSMWSVGPAGVTLEMSAGGTFLAWEIRIPTPAFRGSYGINRNLFSPSMFSDSDSLRTIDVFSLKRRGSIPALLDGAGPNCGMIRADEPPPKYEPSDAHGSPVTATYTDALYINRHDGTLNALFLDWSVRPVGLKELWTLKWHGKFDTHGPWTKAGGVERDDWPPWMRKFKDY
jgi:prepilin-type N-terminal cleavage/methylation domain-containing protein/prepilin-type processing-associated H-X9-DG protein